MKMELIFIGLLRSCANWRQNLSQLLRRQTLFIISLCDGTFRQLTMHFVSFKRSYECNSCLLWFYFFVFSLFAVYMTVHPHITSTSER
jgi:hypothetical protein